MAQRERGERGLLPEFPFRQPPVLVEGVDRLIELFSRGGERRTMLDLNVVIQALPEAGGDVLLEALWRVVEISSEQGVLPLIMPVNRAGNLVESPEN